MAQLGGRISRNPARYTDSFFVLETAGQVVGALQFESWGGWHVVGGMEDHDPALHDTLSVSRIAVLEAWRNQGLGSRLLREWLAQFPEHIEYVVLDPVPASGPGAVSALRHFYVQLGFQLLQRPRRYSDRAPHLMGWSRAGVLPPLTRV